MASGETGAATNEIQKALDDAAAWYLLGLALEREQSREQALSAFRRTLEIEPSNKLAYLRLGRLLVEMEQREEALRYLRHGAEFGADPDEIRQELAKLRWLEN